MARQRRIMVSLPAGMLQEVDGITSEEKLNRSQLIREAMRFYLEERKRRHLREQLRRGYVEMAQLNLELAQEGPWDDGPLPLPAPGGRAR